ncbi:MAG: site-specific integrase [Sphingomonas sp.]|uniref:site-specific integrase n=1 Tax=Sphingomonas sp. TaxID=28214 RepID=UPI0026220A30|nr:site-specific integrase [Sphingomonas sp.]MDK2767838.1 site-specific integrase [Sphingomonas sp.]
MQPTTDRKRGPYYRKNVRFDGGERFAFMCARSTDLPDAWALRYALAKLRQKSINLANRVVDSLCLFYEWAENEGIDVTQRLESGDLFSPMEIENLSEFMRTSKKAPLEIGAMKVKRVVVGNTHKDRMKRVLAYVDWRMSHISLVMTDQSRVYFINARLAVLKNAVANIAGSKQKQREALTDEELDFLMQVVRPDDPRNPFAPHTRDRNFCIVLFFVELGMREAEPLVLKSEHVNVAGRHPGISIVPNPNDPEEHRTDPPLVKTNGRDLPISPLLAFAMDRYIMKWRTKLPGHKRNPFIFLETNGGAAMSLDALYDIFRTLRARFPHDLPADLSSHRLRHTWNSRFRRLASEYGWPEAFRRIINNYIMGWNKTSEQDARYAHSEIVREAAKILRALHAPADAMKAAA